VISKEIEARILRLFHAEGWKIGTIGTQLGLHHTTVRRVLSCAGVPGALQLTRPSMIDPYLALIQQTLGKYPELRASRLYEMVRSRGYPGGPDHFRHLVALRRPRAPAEAYLRLRTLPAEQGQIDWGAFGTLRIGRAERRLCAFVMVLSYSRAIFLRFFLDQRMPSFLCGHALAFAHFSGCPRILLYDNLKSAVLERDGEAIRFHPELLALATHYRFEARPVAPARGNEKGRVERAIQYIRHAFFAARPFRDLEDLNAQALAWCTGPAAERRCPEDPTRTVREVFAEEQPRLLPLPDAAHPTDERLAVHVGKQPYARFDGNDYSLPHTHVRRTLALLASLTTVRIFQGTQLLAEHPRSYDRGETVENPAHLAELTQHKRQARSHRATDRLTRAVPQTRPLLAALAERGTPLGSATSALLRLLDHYGAAELRAALDEVLEHGTPHPHAVRLVLERRRMQRGQLPPLAVQLPDDPRVRDLVVTPHALERYDPIPAKESDDDL
jgi:transposase